jgi:site-specific DNA-methyltransferase (adenine-specific)
MKHKPLTPKQKEVLDFITSFLNENGYSPSLEEIARHLQLRSVSTIHQFVEALEEKGYLNKVGNKQRSLEPILSEIEIPLIGFFADGEPIETFSVPEAIKVQRSILSKSGMFFGLKVKGDSLYPEGIGHGDTLIVRRQEKGVSGNNVIALVNECEAIARKIYKDKNGYRVKPINSKSRATRIKGLQIQGKIVGILPSVYRVKSKTRRLRDQTIELDTINTGDVLTLMRLIPDSSVHLAITSPPYNVGKEYDSHHDRMNYQEYLNWLDQVWFETKRVLVPGGRFALNIAPTGIKDFIPIHHDFIAQQRRLGMKFRTEILWYKQTMLKRTAWGSFKSPSNPHIVPSWEYVLVFSKEKDRLDGDPTAADITNKEFIQFSDGFWEISPETKRNGHPAPFPEELIYRLIKFYSYKGNTILDMFGGTGTVALVAQRTDRHFIHIDVSKSYNEVAEKRLKSVEKPLPLFNTAQYHRV